ncbi:hypothetical protein S-MbCM7_202 [Synechococcus phage ACG-2014h]|jgi:hypothetical protein|uniref:Uncharacterized protein n=1 Tax=Synechococcus phage ACG-2014h TaxID=1340810 RepID=V5URK7_9CAUD|nr:hypothetical protein S-MbCM7_202 [Synechococcus phage ACG-2014h]AHB80616.1 hypothetical protein S-MbCM7_202 [Synechococcus phage ACG-2014h]
MTETLLVYISATVSFIFLCIGVFAGWTVNEKMHEYMYASSQENVHPEMFDGQGQWINEELLSVRFVDEEELEEE